MIESSRKIGAVVHVITGLNCGGAEAALFRLCMILQARGREQVVVSLMDRGVFADLLEENGVRIVCLDMPRGRVTLSGLCALYRLLREVRPAVVQTWMYHADLVGGVIARLAGIRTVVWGLHNAMLAPESNSLTTRLVARLCALLSRRIPVAIISCSAKAAEENARLGYARERMEIIPNGYPIDEFKPDPEAGAALRQSLDIAPDVFVVGMVARYEPPKDHATLLAALRLLDCRARGLVCVLAGEGILPGNDVLMHDVEGVGPTTRIVLLGRRSDIPAVMNMLDLHVLSSLQEAFPNVLGEAMACGVPCIGTDVGDIALILEDTGWLFPPRDVAALVSAMTVAEKEWRERPYEWQRRKAACRARITTEFGMERMADHYEAVWSGRR